MKGGQTKMLEAEVYVYTWNDSIDTLIQDFANGRMLTVSDGQHGQQNQTMAQKIYQRWKTHPRTTGCTRSIPKRARRITRNYYHSMDFRTDGTRLTRRSSYRLRRSADTQEKPRHRPRTAVHKLQTFRHHCSINVILERNEIHHLRYFDRRTGRLAC